MEATTTDGGALFETVVFLDHFNDLPDPRQHGKVMYPLESAVQNMAESSVPGSVAAARLAISQLSIDEFSHWLS